jgi:hypothetical protein
MGTVREAITEYAQGRGEPVSNHELNDALPFLPETIRRTLHRMVESGDMLPEDGRYALATSHPDSPQPSASFAAADTRATVPGVGDSEPDTPLYAGGIGVYDPNVPGGMRSWKGKAGQ